ncbi:MAG: tRNA (adenosine(37)-N6)-threonylcarbamoyltransferase complex dimerization subunit type 1 TsaB [Rhizobiaceae bacterium]
MITLAIDTSASLCAAGVFDGETELGRSVLDLGKGHAEHLMAVIDQALKAAGGSYRNLGAIAVAIGPGSFTGVRVGVSTARGLALALKIPAIGVSNLEAVAAAARSTHPNKIIFPAFASGRGDIQAALYDPFGNIVYDPAVIDLGQAVRLATEHDALVVGSAVTSILAENPKLQSAGAAVTADIATYARLAQQPGRNRAKPAPLYLREPDAKPQASFVLPRAGG